MKNPFQLLEITMQGRCLNLYHGLLGKHCVTIEGAVELLELFCTIFCPAYTCFICSTGHLHWIGKKSKRLIIALHSMEKDPKQIVYCIGSKPLCVQEKMLILKTLSLMNAVVYGAGRVFTQKNVYLVKSKITTILTY